MKVGRYDLLRRIAVGGMAEIYLARESGLAGFQRPAIVKRLLPALSVDADFVEMFLDEARVAARLAHPNIVHIYELGRDGARYFIAMEYVPGCDLQTLLDARPGPMPIGEALFVVAELLEGLSYAHSLRDDQGLGLGIVHRDIAPKNLLLSLDGAVKIVDFGVAKVRTKVFVTAPGTVMGTYNYMSPEHARGRPVDRRADLFAAGAVLYRLATGAPPYREDDEDLVEAVRSATYQHPRVVQRDLPDEVVGVILRAMDQEPQARYQTAAEMRREVLRALRRLGGGADGESLALLVRQTLPDLEVRVKAWLAGTAEDLGSSGGGPRPPPRVQRRGRGEAGDVTVPMRPLRDEDESTADLDDGPLTWGDDEAAIEAGTGTVRLGRPPVLAAPESTLDLALSPDPSPARGDVMAELIEAVDGAGATVFDTEGESFLVAETEIDLGSPPTARLHPASGPAEPLDEPVGVGAAGVGVRDDPQTIELLLDPVADPQAVGDVHVPDLYEESEEDGTDSTTLDMDPERAGGRRRRGRG